MTKPDERPWRYLVFDTIEQNGSTLRLRAPSVVNCAAIYFLTLPLWFHIDPEANVIQTTKDAGGRIQVAHTATSRQWRRRDF